MRSRSTCDTHNPTCFVDGLLVSISDEKPLHMRRGGFTVDDWERMMFQSQMRSRSTCDGEVCRRRIVHCCVSISDEKPLHMRRSAQGRYPVILSVSISDEKPLHMRPNLNMRICSLHLLFQSQMRSDEKPLHMRRRVAHGIPRRVDSFNLR